MPLLAYVNTLIGCDMTTAIILTILHLVALAGSYQEHTIIRTTLTREIIKDITFVISTFLILLCSRNNNKYSIIILMFALFTRFVYLIVYRGKLSERSIIEFLTFACFGLTYFYKEYQLSFTFACVYVCCLIASTLYSSSHMLNEINNYLVFFNIATPLKSCDNTKYLTIWFVIKMWYLLHCFLDCSDIFIPAFHIIFGVIFLMGCVKNISNVQFFVQSHTHLMSLTIFGILMIVITFNNFILTLKAIMFVSFFVYTYFQNSDLPSNTSVLLLIFNSVFMCLLYNNL